MKSDTVGVAMRAGAVAILLASGAGCAHEEPPLARGPGGSPSDGAVPAAAGGAVRRSLPLLEGTARAFASQQTCSSCHIQAVPSMTLALAREHGFAVDDQIARAQAGRIYGRALATAQSGLTQSIPGAPLDEETANPSLLLGAALSGLAASRLPSDDNTDKIAGYLANLQGSDGRWTNFAATAFAVRALSAFAPQQRAREFTTRIGRARSWLVASPPQTTSDKAFRLLGLRWAGAGVSETQQSAADLLADQGPDGGWPEVPSAGSIAARVAEQAAKSEAGAPSGAPSNPSATGQVLVALHQAAGLPVTHPAYARGARYLLATQRADGSWASSPRKRPYCQGGFVPVALRASSWATMALAEMVAPAEGWETGYLRQ